MAAPQKYASLLSVPVVIMFITISWREISMIFKIIVTVLVILHIIAVTAHVGSAGNV